MKVEGVSRKVVKGLVAKPLSAVKGDAGSVLVVIASDQYPGAATMAALAALRSGVDYAGIAAPKEVARLINGMTPDLVTHKLDKVDADSLEPLFKKYTTILLGPGLDLEEKAVGELIEAAKKEKKPLVLDADATTMKVTELDEAILLLNKSEFEALLKKNEVVVTEKDVPNEKGKKSKKQLEDERLAMEREHLTGLLGNNVLVAKNHIDMIHTKEKLFSVEGGSLRATVAGTGDIIAGLAAGFRAQKLAPTEAAMTACVVAKRAAELLEEKRHYSFLASEYLKVIPDVLKELKLFRTVKHT